MKGVYEKSTLVSTGVVFSFSRAITSYKKAEQKASMSKLRNLRVAFDEFVGCGFNQIWQVFLLFASKSFEHKVAQSFVSQMIIADSES